MAGRSSEVVDLAREVTRSAVAMCQLGTTGIRDLALVTQAQDPDEKARAIQAWALQAATFLPKSALLWVSSEMASVVGAAAKTMPDHAFLRSALPWPDCFCVVEGGVVFDRDPHRRPVDAFHWTDFPDEKRVLCSMFETSYSRKFFMLMATFVEGEPISLGDPTGGTDSDGGPGRWLACLWLLLQQRVAVLSRRPADRPSARRWRREHNDPVPEVIEVVLRRPASGTSAEAERNVDWSHRWLVGGHWRNQWMPSMGVHRPTWIAPYVKGPADKPLVVKDKVNVFVR